jgi:methionyl-tRNA formyltransferase
VRLVLLVGPALPSFQEATLLHLLAHRRDDVVGAVIDQTPVPSIATRLKKNLERGRGGYIAIIALQALRGRGSRLPAAASRLAGLGFPVIETTAPYGPECLEAITRLEPDVLCRISGFGIVKEPLLSIAPQGVLSYHHGDMRRYRGQPPGFWELYHGERIMGVTVQRLAAGIDCGEPIVERQFEIRRDDTLSSLSERIYGASADMLSEAVDRVEAGQEFSPLDSSGLSIRFPTSASGSSIRSGSAAG